MAPPEEGSARKIPARVWWWFGASLAAIAWPYALVLKTTLAWYPNAAHDDALGFVVWTRHLMDASLYAGDLVASTKLAVMPWLYREFLATASMLGLDPLLTHVGILMPVSGIALVTATFWFVYGRWKDPAGAAVTTFVLPFIVGLPQGLPRDFGYAIVMCAVLMLRSRRPLGAFFTMLVATGLSLSGALAAAGSMSFLMLTHGAVRLTREARAWRTLVAGAAGSLMGILLFRGAAVSGAALTMSDVRAIPLLGPDGHRPYFGRTFSSTYLCHENAGLIPLCEGGSDAGIAAWTALVAAILGTGLWVLSHGGLQSRRMPWWQPAVLREVDPRLAGECAALISSGVVLFLLAHALAFSLHMPERYARYGIGLTFALVLSLGVAMAVVSTGRRLLPLAHGGRGVQAVIGLCTVVILISGARLESRQVTIVRSSAPEIHEYLRRQTKSVVVAGVADEIDNVPAFGGQSVLVSMESLRPYTRAYLDELSTRLTSLGNALYASDRSRFAALVHRYNVSYVLLERRTDDAIHQLDRLAQSFPAMDSAARFARNDSVPFFRAALGRCTVAGSEFYLLADATCLIR